MFQLIDAQFDKLSSVVGLPSDQLQVVITFLICIPLGLIQRLITNPTARNLYCLLIGGFLQYVCVKEWSFLVAAMSLLVYIMVVVFKKNSAVPVFFSTFAVLFTVHLLRYINDDGEYKVSGDCAYMMAVCQMIYFAFYISDGQIKQVPNILEYFGFIFFYASVIAGPVYDFQTYSNFIHMRDRYSNIPSSIGAALYHLMLALVYTLGLLFLVPKFSFEYLLSDELLAQPFFFKVYVFFLIGYIYRCRYFAAFQFAQSGMNATGISFNGYDEKTKKAQFDHIKTMDEMFDFTISPQLKTDMWNTSVQHWLKDCFYARVTNYFKGSTLKATMAVFLISAIWHGVHPTYYIGFVSWGILIENVKFFYKARAQFEWIPNIIQKPIMYIYGTLAINNVGLWILILDFKKANQYMSSVCYFMSIIEIAIFIFFLTTKYGQSKEKRTTQQQSEVKSDKKTN